MIRIRRILTAAMATMLLLSAIAIPAAAHGHRGGRQSTSVYCSYCQESHTQGTHCEGCDYQSQGSHHGGRRGHHG